MPTQTLIKVLISFLLIYIVPFAQKATNVLNINNEKENSTVKLKITPEGSMLINVPTNVGEITSSPQGALVIEKVTKKVAISENYIQVNNTVRENNITPTKPGDLEIANQVEVTDLAQAVIGSVNALSLNSEKKRTKQLISAVAYVDNLVYEREMTDDNFVYKYANVANEGKSDLNNAFRFYLKDHLGSTRRVQNEKLKATEVIGYQAYGTQIPIRKSSESPVRDNFTSKEFDREGKIGSVDLDIQITGFDDNSITSKTVAKLTINLEGISFEKAMNLDMLNDKVFLSDICIVHTNEAIQSVTINISKSTPEINYIIPFQEDVELGDEITLTLNKTAIEINNASQQNPVTDLYTIDRDDYNAYVGLAMNYFGARYYDPDVGSWVSTDPAGQHFNRYLYGSNNPINRVDPDGLMDWFIFVEGEAAAFSGLDFSAGLVLDTDNPGESGFFMSGAGTDKTSGASYGIAIGGGFAKRELEGKSIGYDFNLIAFSGTISFDDKGFLGLSFSIGPGKGGVVSETETSTYTALDFDTEWSKALSEYKYSKTEPLIEFQDE